MPRMDPPKEIELKKLRGGVILSIDEIMEEMTIQTKNNGVALLKVDYDEYSTGITIRFTATEKQDRD